MQSYEEVERKYDQLLNNAQRKLLQERAKTLSIGNAPQRMDMQTSAIRGRRQKNEMLSNYGLASSLNRNASSGADETARRMSGFQSSMQQLRAQETAQLDQYGYRYAQETIAARQRAAEEEERRRRAAAAAAARKKAAAQNQKAAQNAIGFVNEAVKNGMSEDQAAKYMSALYTGDVKTAEGVEKQYVGSAQHNFGIAAVAEIDKSVAAGAMDRRAGEYIAQQIQQKNYEKAQHGLSVARIDATKRISASTQEALKSGKITQKQATAINTALINGNLTVANIALRDYQKHQEMMTRPSAAFNQDIAAAEKAVRELESRAAKEEKRKITNVGTGETRTGVVSEETQQELNKEKANLETLRQYQALRTQERVDTYSALDIDTLNNLEAQFEAEKKLILESGHANGKTDYERETEIGEKLNAIGQAKQNITLAARQAEYEAIQAEVMGQADFQAQSAIGAELQEYDTVHASINGHSDIIAQKMALEGDIAGGKVVRSDLETAGLMNDDEKAAYNYYYAKGGLKAAREYLASIETHLNQRRAEQIELMATYRTNGRDLSVFMNEIEQATYTAYIAQRGESAAEEYLASLEPVLKERRGDVLIDRELPAWMGATTQSIASILATPAEFVGSLYSMKQTLLGEEIDPYDRAFTASIYKNAVRSSVANEIAQNIYDEGGPEVLAEALAFGYQTAMSIGDNLLMVYLGSAVGKVAGAAGASVKGANLAREIYQLGTMSLGAAASTTQSLIARGVSEDQAMAVGFAAGVFEAIFEKVSLDNLLDMPTQQVVPWLRRTLTQAGVEATEEFCTEIANTITNNIVLGDQSDFNAAVAEYMRQGKTFAEAQSQAMIDIMVNIGLAAAGGFLSGGLLGGSSAFRQDLQTKKIGAAIQEGRLGGTQSLLDEASKVTDDKVQKLYAKLNNAYTHNQTLSNLEVGRLNYMVANNGLSQVRTQIDALETEGEIDSKTAKQLKEIAEEMALGGQTPVYENGFLYGKIREAVDAVETRVQEEAAAAEQTDDTWTENVAEDFVMMPTRENIETDPDKVRKQMGIARNVSERFDLDVKQSYKEDGGMTVSLHKADSIDGLTAHQKGMLQFARAIQKMGVVDVVVHDSLDVNGAFDPETNTMHIALDAESTIGAMAHELTHYIKKNAPEQYEALETFLKEQANKARRNGWEQLVREKMAQYKQEGMSEEKLRRLGESEAAAAMCEDMLRDEAKIREFVQRDMKLGEKVLNFIDDVLKNFKSILSGDTHHSEASTLIADIEQARNLWFDALQAAKENRAATAARAAEPAGLEMSLKNTKGMDWDHQIEALYNGNLKSGDSIYVDTLGELYAGFGIEGKDLAIPSSVIINKGKRKHNLQKEDIKRLKKGIKKPTLVVEDVKRDSILVFTGEMDTQGDPIMLAIEKNAEMDFRDIAKVSTIHGRENIIATIENISEKGRAYYDKEKLAEMCRTIGIQPPEMTSLLSKFNIITISESENSVNNEFELSKRTPSEEEQALQKQISEAQREANSAEEKYGNVMTVLKKVDSASAEAMDMATGERMNAQDELDEAVDGYNAARKTLTEAQEQFAEGSDEVKAAQSEFNRARNAWVLAKNHVTEAINKQKELEEASKLRPSEAEIAKVRDRAAVLEQERDAAAQRLSDLKAQLVDLREKEQEAAKKAAEKEREEAKKRGERPKKTYEQRQQERAQRKEEREKFILATEKMPTPEGLTPRKENEDLPSAVQSFARVPRTVTETDEKGVEKTRETDIPAEAEEIAAAVRHNPTFAYQDVARNLDAFAKNNTHLRAVLRDTIERPFNAAGGVYSVNLKSRTSKFLEEMEKLGIETKEESAAVQRIGEGYYQDEYGEQQIYTMEMLKEQFPEKWKNIVQAAELTRKIYDGYIDELNRMLEKIYPNVIEHAETDYRNVHSYTVAAEERVSNQMRHIGKIEYRIEQLQKKLDGKKRTDTKAYTQLENSIARERARLKNAEALLELYEQKAAVRRIQEKEIEEAAASGEILRNRRVLKRADYFHHFTEMEQGFGALMNILQTNFEIDPALAGKTSQTKPKAKWAGFMQRRGEGAYVEDAVNGMLRYMALAEYKLAYDPLAEHLRNVELTVRRAAESGDTKNTNANTFLQWLGEWRNGILGKSSGLDRALSDTGMLGRKAVQVARWVNNRVKSNAILGNARSAIVQVSNVTNGATYIKNPKDWTDGMRLVIQMNYGQNSEELRAIMEESEFMTQRYMDIPVFADTSSTPKKFALAMLNAGDKASAQLMWWSAYNQFQRNPSVGNTIGAGGFDAVQYADEVVRRSVGGRGVGEQPIVLNSQIINMIAPFQTEVMNTFNNMREQLGKKNWEGLMAFEVTTFVLNSVFSALFGDRPLPFDFIGAIWAAMQDLGDDEEPWYKDAVNAAKRFGGEIAAGIPFGTQLASFLLGAEASEQFFGENDPTRYGTGNMGFQAIADAVIETAELGSMVATGKINSAEEAWAAIADRTNLLKVAMPWGGAQVARSIAGIDAVARGYSQKLNKAGELEAQFAVDGNLLKGVQAAAFGKWSLKEAQEYLDGGSPMSAETTAEMKEAKAAGIAPTQFAEIRADMRNIKPVKNNEGRTEVSSVTQKMELLRDDASLTDAQRLLMLKQVDTDGNYYADATEAYTRGVSVSDYLEYVTAYGRMHPIMNAEGKTEKSKSAQIREKLLADELLDEKQKALLDELLTRSESVPDYSSEANFRLSQVSDREYERAMTAKQHGVSTDVYYKYYEVKRKYTNDDDDATGKENVLRAIMDDRSLTAAQKTALEKAMYQTRGKEYSTKDYSNADRFVLSMAGESYPGKADLAVKYGIQMKDAVAYVKAYKEMKSKKAGSGKNGAVNKKDCLTIMESVGIEKKYRNTLYKIMSGDLKD